VHLGRGAEELVLAEVEAIVDGTLLVLRFVPPR
jgi:hypothetical protein